MPIKYSDLKTVAEQSAYDFGQRCRSSLSGTSLDTIGRHYAFAHQLSAFPRSETGYWRLLAAFRAGAEIT
jgi:hypothetical protein